MNLPVLEIELDDVELLAGAMDGLAEIERGECMDADEAFSMRRERHKLLYGEPK